MNCSMSYHEAMHLIYSICVRIHDRFMTDLWLFTRTTVSRLSQYILSSHINRGSPKAWDALMTK